MMYEKQRKRAILEDAIHGIELDADEKKVIEWLLNWELETVASVASIIKKARDYKCGE